MAAAKNKTSTLVVTTTRRIEIADYEVAEFLAAVIRDTGETYFDGWGLYDLDGEETYTATVE